MRKSFIACLFLITCVLAWPCKNTSAEDTGEEIRLYVGDNRIIPVNNPKRVAIGNPAIIDVSNIGKSELTLVAKSVGNTTFIVWDNYGEQGYNLKVFAENTNEIKRRIDNMLSKLNLPNIYTTAEDEESKVVLLGDVKDIKDKDRITTALGPLKEKTVDLITIKGEEIVIEIDVQIIEIYKGSIDTLGFLWPDQFNLGEVAGAVNPLTAVGTNSWGKLFQLSKLARDSFTLTLDALISDHKARVLSRPRISVLSGKEAKLLVGGQVPIISGSTSGGAVTTSTSGGTVDYKDYGIVLKVTPQINPLGRIHLNLGVEVSELGDLVTTQNAAAYSFTKRSADTELILEDGQTAGIGGLIKQRSEEDLQKFPWLGDIPILGVFFRHKAASTGKQGISTGQDVELFITLTPHVMSQLKATQKELKPIPPGVPTIADDNISDPKLRYSKIVQKKILENISYPASAKEAGFQGTVRLSLKLSYQGDLLEAKIKGSSNYRILDDEALRVAQKVSPYPPFLPAIKEKDIWVDIPIVYLLE